MITSEVQRTLVKSPPELWAELSDPTSLARHLGELGEIRITRVDPERRVEWETTGASGSVAIKPSGWGTKVTLTVLHEARADEQSAPSTPEPASGPSPDEAAGAPEDPPQALAESGGALDDSAESDAEPGAEPEPEPAPAPVDIAAREPVTALASWAAAFGAERSGSTRPAPKARFESDIAPVATVEHDRDLHEARAEQALPQRGLFGWLFRRRRRPAGAATSLPGTARTPAPEELPPEVASSAPGASTSAEPPALEQLDEAPGPEAAAGAPVAPAPAHPKAGETAGADDLASGGEGHQAEAPDAGALDAKADAETSTADTNAHVGADAHENADPGADADAETSTAHTDASAEAETSTPDAPGAETQPEQSQPLESGADGEHAAERGAEEVTAVLTAVLDRLGAAHHRPFSRG